MTDATTEAPTHCEECEQPLLLRRPGRTRCERCNPTMRERWLQMINTEEN